MPRTSERPSPIGRMRGGFRDAAGTWAHLATLGWILLGLAVLLASGSLASREFGIIGLSTLALLWGLTTYWVSGGPYMSARGLFGFGIGLFIGAGGLFTLWDTPWVDTLPVLAVSYFSALLISFFFRQGPLPTPPPAKLAPERLRFLLSVSGLGAALALLPGMPREVDDPLFLGSLIMALNALAFAGRPFWAMAVGLAGFAGYYFTFWDGFGRLLLGALGLALAASMAPWFKGRVVKLAVLVALVPTLLVMANSRVELVAEINPNGEQAGTGFESVAAPVYTGAEVLDLIRDKEVEPALGHTYIVSLLAGVPRSIWTDKPKGWGSEVTPYTKPELAETIHSEAPNGLLEPIWNFGLPGLLLFIPLIGLAVRGIDNLLFRAYSAPVPDLVQVVAASCAWLLATSLPDLIWAGSFTMFSRGVFRVAFLLALVMPFLLYSLGRRRRNPRPSDRSAVRQVPVGAA